VSENSLLNFNITTFALAAFVQRSCEDDQIGNEDAPADPTLEALEAMHRTTLQLDRALEHTDATFDAIAEALTLLEPALLFMGFTLGCARSRLGPGNLLDAELLGQAFILGGEDPAIACQHMRGLSKALAMLAQQGWQHLSIGWIALGDDLPIANQPVFDFGIVDLVSEFRLVRRRFAASNNLRVGFAQTGEFGRRGNHFALQHAPHGLVNDALDQR